MVTHRFTPMKKNRLLRSLSFAGACLGLAFSAVNAVADEPMPFPPEADTAPVVEGAKLPKLIKRVEPVGPAESAALQQEQRVYVAFVVDAQGKVGRATAMFEPPAAFAKAAVDAVRQWEFEPGLHSSSAVARAVPVSTQMTVLLHFLPAGKMAAR